MPLGVKKDVTLDPVDMGLLGTNRVMPGPYGIADAVRQFLFAAFCHNLSSPLAFFILLVHTGPVAKKPGESPKSS